MISSTQGTQSIDERNPLEGTLVLIVSNNREFLHNYRKRVMSIGLVPITASTLEGALSCLRILVVAFIIMDQGGLGFEGRAILERARRTQVQATVVVITREPDSQCRSQALAMGAADYLVEPVDAMKLRVALIRSIYSGHGGKRSSPADCACGGE